MKGLLKDSSTISVRRSFLLILLAAVFAAGIFLGRSSWIFGPGRLTPGMGTSVGGSDDFRFIRRSTFPVGSAESRKVGELKPFRYKVDSLIEKAVADDKATFVAVYFRDLENGNWFGIREHETFAPEVRLKIPLMIAYFKWAESNPLVLRKRIPFSSAEPGEESHLLQPPPRALERGRSYTVNELIFRMVAYNDANAYDLLAARLPASRLKRIYKDLNVNYDPAQKDARLSLNAYGSFFRVLFNASYLSEEMSEKALRILSRSVFREGMRAGIPSDIDLASKAGEIVITAAENGGEEQFQLHEFGIVYHPRRPFLLGVTVRGSDEEELPSIIRDVTELVYREVDRQ